MSFIDKIKKFLKESEQRAAEKMDRDFEKYEKKTKLLRAEKKMLREKAEVDKLKKKSKEYYEPPPVKL